MRWAIGSAMVCVMFLLASPAVAGAADRQACDLNHMGEEPDFWGGAVAACTRVIDDSRESQKARSCAHLRRAHFRWLNQDQGAANTDLAEALRLDPRNAAAYALRALTWDDAKLNRADLDKWTELGADQDCSFD